MYFPNVNVEYLIFPWPLNLPQILLKTYKGLQQARAT